MSKIMGNHFIHHFILILLSYGIQADLQQQYVFAHRVNDKNNIASALSSGVNGIELDLCYNNNWIVSHNSSGDTLQDWLIQLNNTFTSFPTYINQLAMLFFDFKTPGNINIDLVPKIVHSIQLPYTLKILYALVAFDTNGQNAFQKIKNLLTNNEGISFCAGKSCGGSLSRVTDIYNYYKNNKFKRGIFHAGNSFNIDKSFLTKANTIGANISDPYRFKLVFVWTIGDESQMNDYMNPSNLYKTDGQIIGAWWRGWQTSDLKYVTAFNNVIDIYCTTDVLTNAYYDPFINIQMVETGQFVIARNDNNMNDFFETHYEDNNFQFIVLGCLLVSFILMGWNNLYFTKNFNN
eukprot:204429_1